MTPTPQERTELQRLAEQVMVWPDICSFEKDVGARCAEAEYNSAIEWCGYCLGRTLASALISLAAESEELRAELEKERAEKAALEAETDRLAADVDYLHQAATGGYSLEDIRARFTNATRAAKAESRYSVLVEAAREYREATWEYDGKAAVGEFVDNTRLLAADDALSAILTTPSRTEPEDG